MTDPVYRADPPTARRAVEIEGLTLVYHRPSGLTHILAPPAPELLDALGEGQADAEALLERLARNHDIEADSDARAEAEARLAELEAAGLVWRA
ncbi:MAG: HPr-rel-A system PqqD family peptide chaperone [Sphingomonadaceae bacterium]|nr:HPr-rel-A system PqqD family peptide chaperone [Sphingomonadaceae bacterium]